MIMNSVEANIPDLLYIEFTLPISLFMISDPISAESQIFLDFSFHLCYKYKFNLS